MSWAQYLAIRKVIDLEIRRQPDNIVLPKAVTVLLDNDDLPESEFAELQEALKTIAKGMVSRSVNRKIARKLAVQTIDTATSGIDPGVLADCSGAGITTWLEISRAGNE